MEIPYRGAEMEPEVGDFRHAEAPARPVNEVAERLSREGLQDDQWHWGGLDLVGTDDMGMGEPEKQLPFPK
jgi:hypothetical protein